MFRSVSLLVSAAALCCSCAHAHQEARSPDGRYLARVGTVDGGAMSSGATSVSLSAAGASLPLLRHDVFFTSGIYDVEVRWNHNVLEVVCEYCPLDRVEVKQGVWNEVHIVYPRFGARAVSR